MNVSPVENTRMKRFVALVALVALVAPAAPAFADVTVKSTMVGKGMGMQGNMTSTTYIKGGKMRTEMVMGDTTRVTIFDVDAQKMYSFDLKKKEADVFDIQKMSADMQKSVSVEGMKMVVNLTGPIWIVKGAPGTQEYVNFYKTAVEKGWFFSDPRQAKAMAEVQRQMAATGGIPYEQEMTVKMSGDGPMASMLAKMGNITMTTTVTSLETTPLAADLFAVPAGYKLKEQK